MMNKVNAACQSLAAGTRKNVLERLAGQQVKPVNNKRSKPSSPKGVYVISKPGTTLEVFVTTDGRKSGSTMVSGRKSASSASKVTDDSRTNNWSKTLRDQSRPAMKQGVQQLAAQTQSSKHTRHENSERKEIKTSAAEKQTKAQKYLAQDNIILDEIPVKQPARKPSTENVRTAPNSAVPSTTTIASSMESIEVYDRAVQCGGIFDRTNDQFGAFNPVRTIGFLMKEMEGLVRDERSSKILTEMEQALMRIPADSGKSPPVLDATTAKLAETSAKIESTCAAQREEIETLLQQVNKQAALLDDAKQRERNLESDAKQMKVELNEALKSVAESRRTISQLQQERRSVEVTEKMLADLRRELNEQIELAEQRSLDVQYLQLEKEKFMTLSSYKDSKLVELRTVLKEIQNHISEQLIDIREAGKRVQDAASDHPMSVIVGGAACSSPTSSCSINSIIPASCPEVSEISLATVDCYPNFTQPASKPSNTQLPASYLNGLLDDSEAGRPCDKTQLEFISLPGGEISHAISLSHRKEEEGNTVLASTHNKKEEAPISDRKVEGFHSVPNLGGRNARDSLPRVNREQHKDSRPKSKTRKTSGTDRRRSDVAKSLTNREEEHKRPDMDCASGDPASIKQQFEMMFEDIRQQSKLPVRVPSPPRNYPLPDWSDSSLPTISGISESNVV